MWPIKTDQDYEKRMYVKNQLLLGVVRISTTHTIFFLFFKVNQQQFYHKGLLVTVHGSVCSRHGP
jgi:hypothetical protein